MLKCSSCKTTTLFKKDIIHQEVEGSYICRGGVYEELSDVPTEWRDEASYSEIIISTTYLCSNNNCGKENIID